MLGSCLLEELGVDSTETIAGEGGFPNRDWGVDGLPNSGVEERPDWGVVGVTNWGVAGVPNWGVAGVGGAVIVLFLRSHCFNQETGFSNSHSVSSC